MTPAALVEWFVPHQHQLAIVDQAALHGTLDKIRDAAHVHSPAGGQRMNTGIQMRSASAITPHRCPQRPSCWWLVALDAPAAVYGPHWAIPVSTQGVGGYIVSKLELGRRPARVLLAGIVVVAPLSLTVAGLIPS